MSVEYRAAAYLSVHIAYEQQQHDDDSSAVLPMGAVYYTGEDVLLEQDAKGNGYSGLALQQHQQQRHDPSGFCQLVSTAASYNTGMSSQWKMFTQNPIHVYKLVRIKSA